MPSWHSLYSHQWSLESYSRLNKNVFFPSLLRLRFSFDRYIDSFYYFLKAIKCYIFQHLAVLKQVYNAKFPISGSFNRLIVCFPVQICVVCLNMELIPFSCLSPTHTSRVPQYMLSFVQFLHVPGKVLSSTGKFHQIMINYSNIMPWVFFGHLLYPVILYNLHKGLNVKLYSISSSSSIVDLYNW